MQLTTTLLAALAVTSATAYNGKATFFEQNGAAGSCGKVHKESDFIIAISHTFGFHAHCGDTVTIKNMGGGQNNKGKGKSITATVADTCMGCEQSHIDLSHGAFMALTGGHLDPPGTFNVQWKFN